MKVAIVSDLATEKKYLVVIESDIGTCINDLEEFKIIAKSFEKNIAFCDEGKDCDNYYFSWSYEDPDAANTFRLILIESFKDRGWTVQTETENNLYHEIDLDSLSANLHESNV